MKDRIEVRVWKSRVGKGETLDLYFSNLEDAHSFSRYWATVEGEVVTDDTGGSHPHTLNHYPLREVVDAWMALFEEDKK